MKPRGPRPGDIYLAEFPQHAPDGHEQVGVRPALVLAVPSRPRFPVLLATPMTTDRAQPWVLAAPGIYLRLPKETGSLPADSILLLDQTRALDAFRFQRFLGTLDPSTFNGVLTNWIALFRP